MKEGNPSTILKGTIEEKVFRIEAPMCAVVIY